MLSFEWESKIKFVHETLLESGLKCRDPILILKFRLAPAFLSKKARLIFGKNETYQPEIFGV
jgi:hypothetical protein